ncbi:hypothetical protein AR438_10810 [Chryseobacterium aquaticum]|uniref:Bacterial mobilisation domain-containing protein n=1 Tax=Chryseobacterium aquaticum TaxID=452084 RepID=A0A0Q3HTK7_9FLAO|nr:hypothetical protein [Chryseobacterium aquaticum]KQK26063.1 hypothetical protein AR438_10810 [Chryseobacterium aquaticum]
MEKEVRIFIRIQKYRKEKWKKLCLTKKISLTTLIIDSVESRILDDERKTILQFIEKQDNIFRKIENNINQVAKIANGQNFISEKELSYFSIQLNEIANLKVQQNEIFYKIYSLIADDH